ncbi:hypothetical protein HJD18_02160 [Thermoleophilia bacterium SCSIO 60948]|nr:hypothetical protein HJD18_02160 [Thermoleophilia bacterium SCSIO 60948]
MAPERPPGGSLPGPLNDLAKVARELVAIPARLALRLGELIGQGVLAVLRVVWPLLLAIARALGVAVEVGARVVTPVRALLVVNVLVLLALAATQTVDFRGVSVGVGDYATAGVDSVAPAPEIVRESSTAAHGPAIWILAAVGLGLCVLAVTRLRAAAWGLALVGVVAIVVGLAIDRPAGLDPGEAANAYEGVEAALLDGFWAQLAAGFALLFTGPLLALSLSAAPRSEPARSEAPARARSGEAPRVARPRLGRRARRSGSRPRHADGGS